VTVPVMRYGMDTPSGPNAGVNGPFPGGVTTSKVPRPGHITENWSPFLGAARHRCREK
jgi:hypothetical protein